MKNETIKINNLSSGLCRGNPSTVNSTTKLQFLNLTVTLTITLTRKWCHPVVRFVFARPSVAQPACRPDDRKPIRNEENATFRSGFRLPLFNDFSGDDFCSPRLDKWNDAVVLFRVDFGVSSCHPTFATALCRQLIVIVVVIIIFRGRLFCSTTGMVFEPINLSLDSEHNISAKKS